MAKLGLNLGFLLFQIFNFTVLCILLYAWAYKPILNMLDKRKKKIAQGLEDARIASEARANAEQDAAKIIAEAQSKANQVVRESTERAETAALEIRAMAEAEATKEREAALADVQLERDRMLGDLRAQIAALAIAAAQKLVGESLDEKRQHALIDEFFSGVRAGNVVVLEGASLSGSSAEVTSALPLSAEEMNSVKKDILAKVASQATVSFRVDPNILGGLVIRVGGKILDASVAGQLESLRQSIS
ncbi:MAG: ATP synthase F0 subunit B [Chloroflexi bacterium RBG_19FT_COMBO_49_13]|nr:MAG: ATP synthase F0 subunit B [Chloroflexi bacterium RBG_19FT_COMBO_49_13]